MASGSNGILLQRMLLLLFVFLVFGMTPPIAPVLNGMDTRSHATATSSPAAQCFLNRRMVLSSGFNLYPDGGWSLWGPEERLRAEWKGVERTRRAADAGRPGGLPPPRARVFRDRT